MSNEPIIKFRPEGKPEQFGREWLKGKPAEVIEEARQKGHLADLMAGKKPAPPEVQ
jgi:hypothetical protein